jgi:hypothetical protein
MGAASMLGLSGTLNAPFLLMNTGYQAIIFNKPMTNPLDDTH